MSISMLFRAKLKRSVAQSPHGIRWDGVGGRAYLCMGTVKEANDEENFYLNRPESFRCR